MKIKVIKYNDIIKYKITPEIINKNIEILIVFDKIEKTERINISATGELTIDQLHELIKAIMLGEHILNKNINDIVTYDLTEDK